ncbi:MAG: hypothetical protein K6B41_01660 [Butyrivibrio sp.]|nr:hypothetical protein [Butyrivibrio sp.]
MLVAFILTFLTVLPFAYVTYNRYVDLIYDIKESIGARIARYPLYIAMSVFFGGLGVGYIFLMYIWYNIYSFVI